MKVDLNCDMGEGFGPWKMGDDEGMLAVLAPYAPHRHRVVRYIEAGGPGKPRFGPRFAPKDYREI